MSFSSDVKEEVSQINSLSDKNCVELEFIGYSKTVNVSIVNDLLKFSTESQYNINRFAKLLNNLNIDNYKISLQGKNYIITCKNKKVFSFLEKELKMTNDVQERAFVRGCFLGSGSINNPENKYHIEIILKENSDVISLFSVLEKYGIYFKKLKKENSYIVYSKDGEEISKFLAFIGASTSVLKFEDIRVYRDMRNNVNRLVNCETANLTKTVNASVKQIDAIKKIKERGRFEELTDSLKEIAKVRENNPEATLVELGKMLNPPIGKSGVNHRLKAIIQIAEELK